LVLGAGDIGGNGGLLSINPPAPKLRLTTHIGKIPSAHESCTEEKNGFPILKLSYCFENEWVVSRGQELNFRNK